ncbi:MAG: hypothetical protein WBA76_11365 [Phormidesmis sp.]
MSLAPQRNALIQIALNTLYGGAANWTVAVQALMLSDLLETALCSPANLEVRFNSSSQLSGPTHLEKGSMRYDLPTKQRRYYQITAVSSLKIRGDR